MNSNTNYSFPSVYKSAFGVKQRRAVETMVCPCDRCHVTRLRFNAPSFYHTPVLLSDYLLTYMPKCALDQERNEVTWRPGQEAGLAPPVVEPEVFRKQIYCDEESTCDIVGTFRRPRSVSAPGELCPPSLRPCFVHAALIKLMRLFYFNMLSENDEYCRVLFCALMKVGRQPTETLMHPFFCFAHACQFNSFKYIRYTCQEYQICSGFCAFKTKFGDGYHVEK